MFARKKLAIVGPSGDPILTLSYCWYNLSFKIGRYFQLKSDTPLALCSNVVYKFTCSCDMNRTYYGMSTRHLITRVREHLDFNSIQRSGIKDHILSCDVCSDVQHGIKSFTVIKKC